MTKEAESQLKKLRNNKSLLKRYKAVSKALRYLAANPKHPGLQTHKYSIFSGHNGEDVFEAYAEQSTPAAYRIFWYYGPEKKQITVITITPHP